MKKSWIPMVLRNTDVNQDSGNGNKSTQDTSSSGRVEADDSSNESTLGDKNDVKEPTLEETVRQAYKDSMDKQRSSSAEVSKQQGEEKSSVQKLNETKSKESKEVDKKDLDTSKAKDLNEANKDKAKQTTDKDDSEGDDKATINPKDDDQSTEKGAKSDAEKEEAWLDKTLTDRKPVPYERFKTIYDKRAQLTTELEQVRPVAEVHKQIVDYCETNSISPEQFSKGLELLAAVNNNPAKALETLTAFANDLRAQTGDLLPDDLQAEVDSGDLTEQRAKEIAKYRAEQNVSKKQKERSAQTQAQEREQTFLREVAKDSAVWTSTKQSTDPDFRPKQSPNEVDGKYELVRAKYLAMTSETNAKGEYVYPVRSSADVVTYLERAYKEIDRIFGAMGPKSTKATKNLSSNNSGGNTEQREPNSLADVVKQVGAKHGII